MSGSVRCCIKSVTDVALAYQCHTPVVQAEVTFRVRKNKRRQLLRRAAKGNNIGLRDRFCFQVPHPDPEPKPCFMVLIWTNEVPYPPPSSCHHAPDFKARPCIGRETCSPQRSSGETYSVILSTPFFSACDRMSILIKFCDVQKVQKRVERYWASRQLSDFKLIQLRAQFVVRSNSLKVYSE